MARSEEEMNKMIDALVNLSSYTGLKINRDKSSIIIFNEKEQPEQIQGIKVSKEFKCLGVTVSNKKICFQTQKEHSIQKAKKFAI